MAVEFLQRQENIISADTISRNISALWFESADHSLSENILIDANFKALEKLLKLGTHGYGIERCLYEENDSLPCQIPIVALDYITDVSEILAALD